MKIKKILKKTAWNWAKFWGTHYRIYLANKKKIATILVYHHKIYILDYNNDIRQ